MAYEFILYEKQRQGVLITLNRPDQLNALNEGMRVEMDQAFAAQELFPFPDASHIVLSVCDRVVTTGVFDWDSNAELFVGRTVEAI